MTIPLTIIPLADATPGKVACGSELGAKCAAVVAKVWQERFNNSAAQRGQTKG